MTSPPASPHDHDVAEVAGPAYSPSETAAAMALGIMALLISGLLSLLLSALAEEHRLDASGIGLAAMIEALSTGLVTGLAGVVLKPKRLRLVAAVASAALILVDLATTRASGGGVFAMRALAGLPQGVLLWIAIGFISRTVTPERWAAVLFTGMGITQLAAATVLSAYILPRYGANGGYLMLAGSALLGLPIAAFLPRALGVVPGQEGPDGGAGLPPLRGWIALAATLAFGAAIAAVSVYVVPLAKQAGVGLGVGRAAISVGLACQILGGTLAMLLAGRMRYIHVFWAATAALLTAWTLYASHLPAAGFIGAAGLAGLFGGFAPPFLVPMTIEADPTRRTAVQSGAAQLLAGALGPLLAALVVGERDAHGVVILGGGLLLAALAVVVGLRQAAARPV